MNKVILEHYPASKLPDELRSGIALGASVTVTVEEEAKRPLSREQLLELMQNAQASAPGTSLEEAVARVRALRDEWED
ncbi:hypothetical protein FJ930_20305 [Mesorhizobium sp. B2-4-15]|uniref:hypothetical protein n=1 Tax=unclassified Mesorhizobium TaxID=325217 RepID=UPI001129B03A|nr:MULTISPECIES: hypothetical protein [unclassified Mesorhizobium]TPK69995.1 hypothetical protein FJ930_20305 [Mesorhizobium sp. B2-4-15]TPM28708.1 hypothetical protein FJ958_16350 [Mesorhizobium sp. B2-3-5]